jgi:hypothetical protein
MNPAFTRTSREMRRGYGPDDARNTLRCNHLAGVNANHGIFSSLSLDEQMKGCGGRVKRRVCKVSEK